MAELTFSLVAAEVGAVARDVALAEGIASKQIVIPVATAARYWGLPEISCAVPSVLFTDAETRGLGLGGDPGRLL
jgi:hypothetical protein